MVYPESFDYIVVGGGSAGCVVASRLAESGEASVLLLERGSDELQNPEILAADGFKEAFANDKTMLDRLSSKQGRLVRRSVYVGSGRGMGGSGSVNGTVYTRGDKKDFECWPVGWKWQDVAPAFQAVEAELRVRTREPTELTGRCIEAAAAIGFQQKNGLNDGDLCGYIGYNDMNYEGESRRSSYVSFIREKRDALQSLTIKHHCVLKKIHFDDEKTAKSIDYWEGGVKKRAGINRELILCAGALETPKLLMLSGVGPRRELDKFHLPLILESSQIGCNLQDHPMVCLFYEGNRESDFNYPQLYGFHRFNRATSLPAGQADTCVTLFAASSVMQKTLHRMIPLMMLPGALYQIQTLRKCIRGCIDLVFKIPAMSRFVSRMYGMVVILGKPVSRGRLGLRSTDPCDQAEIDLSYFSAPEDMETLMTGVRQMQRMMQQPSMSEWGNKLLSKAAASDDKQELQKWIEASVATAFHFSGTCSMGEGDAFPVDTRLRLKGTGNVRVADASVIPDVPVSALNAPTMMIAYRAADFILQDLGLVTGTARRSGTESGTVACES